MTTLQTLFGIEIPVIQAPMAGAALTVLSRLWLRARYGIGGTLLCPEATTSPVHRAALKGEQARRTALTNLFTGRPARGIVNRLMTELGAMSEVPAFPLAAAAIAPLRARAESAGSGDFSPPWAGQNVCGCAEVSAATLTRQLVAGMVTLTPPDSAR